MASVTLQNQSISDEAITKVFGDWDWTKKSDEGKIQHLLENGAFAMQGRDEASMLEFCTSCGIIDLLDRNFIPYLVYDQDFGRYYSRIIRLNQPEGVQ